MEPAALADFVSAKIRDSQAGLLSQLDSLITDKLGAFQQKIGDNQRELSDVQIAKIEELNKDEYRFRKRGNEEQYKVNVKVARKLKEADALLNEEGEAGRREAQDRISEGIDILSHRQKLIKIADSSEGGWATVDEYVKNSLADNSEDEKRLFRAESRAQKRKKDKDAAKKRRPFRRFTPYRLPLGSSGAGTSMEASPAVREPRISSYPGRKPGSCFSCGKAGHWRAECREAVGGGTLQSSKISEINFPYVRSSGSSMMPLSNGDDLPRYRTSPVGRLRDNYGYWEDIHANESILNIVAGGYKLPLFSNPTGVYLSNNRSALNHAKFVEEEIAKLLEKGCITEVEERPLVVNPLTVSENKGKLRLVLDCRHINPHLFKEKFKYEDDQVVSDVFDKGDHVFTFDLKSAYHHIEVCKEHRQYLGFAGVAGDRMRYYVFNVLPFGLSTAGYVFTKVLRSVVSHWRDRGHKVIMFLDDGIAGHNSLEEARALSTVIQMDLKKLGFLLAEEKCAWEPVLQITWLGLDWDFANDVMHVSNRRVEDLKSAISVVLSQVQDSGAIVHVRLLAKIVGQIVSMHSVLGPLVQLKTRESFKCVNSRASWNAPVLITPCVLDELKFWRDHIDRLNTNSISGVVAYNYSVYTDASSVGYGGYVVECDDFELTGVWSESESIQSSTWRELEAVVRTALSLEGRLQGLNVRWHTDNKNVVKIVRTGSNNPELQEKAIRLRKICEENKVKVDPVWVPRNGNKRADALSRMGDSDDWHVNWAVYFHLDKEWGPHDYDRFACHYNAKCYMFNSRWWCNGTSGIDAFSQSWTGKMNWWVPPPRLIARVIDKTVKENAMGTLIVPYWRSAPYWPKLWNGNGFYSFVKDHEFFASDVISRGRGRNGIFGDRKSNFSLIALKVRF